MFSSKKKEKQRCKDVKKNINELWDDPIKQPTDAKLKQMWTETVVTGVKLVMSNHVYKFDNELRIQTDKGSIGLKLTGVLAEIKMLIGVSFLR